MKRRTQYPSDVTDRRNRLVNCILPGVVAWRGWQVPSGDQRWRVLVGEGNGNGSGAA